jgi:hypothetical protein
MPNKNKEQKQPHQQQSDMGKGTFDPQQGHEKDASQRPDVERDRDRAPQSRQDPIEE